VSSGAEAAAEAEMSSPEPSTGEKTGIEPSADKAKPVEAEKPATVKVDYAETPMGVTADSQESSSSFTSGITWRLALGLALGAVAVVVAGFVLVRKQG
jgi:hypothetical protein